MSDGKIYITLSDKRGEITSGGGGKNQKQDIVRQRKSLPDELKLDTGNGINAGVSFLQHEMMHFARQQASQYINYSIENIGNFTGNYQAQRDIQAALGFGSMMSNIAMAGISVTVMTGNPVLGAFASTVALGARVINYNRQEKANQFRIKRQNREIELMRDISGLNSLTNGGRIGD